MTDATHNFTGTLDSLTLLDETIGTEQDNTDLAGLEVHAHALDAGSEPLVTLLVWMRVGFGVTMA